MYTLDANYWIISKNGKWGVLSMTGFEYIPCIYDDIKHISTGLFLVHENGVEKKLGKIMKILKIRYMTPDRITANER